MSHSALTNDHRLYTERLSSNRTLALFLALIILFLLLSIWRLNAVGMDILALVCLFLCGIFLFYSVNYRTLVIRINAEALVLSFGIFTWKVQWGNVETCNLDEIPAWMRYGGAGIHFMNIGKRYRASFNFLEYPRVVISFKRRIGPVRDLSFSTRHPQEVLACIRAAISRQGG